MSQNLLNDAENEILRLNNILKNKESEILRKKEQINILKKELEEKTKECKKYSKIDEFKIFLGTKTYEQCENSSNEKITNYCKDLYFNFAKNG
jgi:molecular chaperone GrpE (heat shock protein)